MQLGSRRFWLPLLGVVTLAGACSETVPLGSWEKAPSSGGSVGAGGSAAGAAGEGNGGSTGGEAGGSCTRSGGTVGPLSTGTTDIGATLTATDWTFGSRSDAMEVDLTIETEPPAGGDGYLWSYQFTLAGNPQGLGGFVGLQANGAFQHPDTLATDYGNRLAVFWVAGALDGNVDEGIPASMGLKYSTTKFNTPWLAINVIYPWESCRPYRLRVARQSVENGDIWYWAWVTDTVTGVRTAIGRHLVPGAWGQLTTTSTSWCDRIGWAQPTACSAVNYVSAVWSPPSAGTTTSLSLTPTHKSHFNLNGSTSKCPTSRLTEFTDGSVRHESAVPQ